MYRKTLESEASYFNDVADIIGMDIARSIVESMNRNSLRVGQAFMLHVDLEIYNLLNGSIYDPFHKDSWYAVWCAVDYYTRG